MKRLFFTLLAVIITISYVAAQIPQSFSYQAIARDNKGKPIETQNISVKIGILEGSSGPVLY